MSEDDILEHIKWHCLTKDFNDYYSTSDLNAIEGLLALYNKEKEKNAELEVKCQMQEYRINVIDERELISKDTIRKLIKDKCYKDTYNYETIRVSDLEELLKGEE